MKTHRNIHILLAISGLALATALGYAQANGPLPIIWQATYGPGVDGGTGWAIPYDFVQTTDGGFLIVGTAIGPANDIRTPPICESTDYWVIKIDAQGQRQWDKSCGGDYYTIAGESASRVFLTEGGFVLAGFSDSKPGCCKTAPLLSDMPNFWVVRYEADGNKLWDQSYLPDGLSGCWADDFEQTADGGYLGCGFGFVGQEGAYYGIVRLDAQGQQLWTKKIGCQSSSAYASAMRILETADGGFVVAGVSDLQPCADKTSPYFGGYYMGNFSLGSDFWIVRCDAQQNKLWDRSYGGANADLALDIHLLADGGFMVFGASESSPETDPTKGTKTSPHHGLHDYWVIRIDAQGNQLWDKSYGGTGDDVCTHAEPMPDGGWLLSGTSTSVPSGNKTSPAFGSSDIWIVRIDDQGNKLWEQSFGGSEAEGKQWRASPLPRFTRERIKRTADGGFLLTGLSQSPASDLKTAPLISLGDFWVLKLGPEPPSLRGEVTSEGKFQLRLIGPSEFEYIIQGSADLVAWTDLATVDIPTGKAIWTDPETAGHRFYRTLRKVNGVASK